MNAADLLLAGKSEKRRYVTGEWYVEMLGEIAESYGSALRLERPWNEEIKLVQPAGKKQMKEVVQVRHLICEEPADATIIERHFGVKLPADIHEFYSRISQCTLALRWLIQVHSPEGVVKLEDYRRGSEAKVGLPRQPIRLIRFAETQEGDCFAFRQRQSDDKWVIGFASHELDLKELQSELYDKVPLDEDIASWMERMLQTQGFPLRKGREHLEKTYINLE